MRSMLRSVLVALVAVFAVGAVASASASAELPVFETAATGLTYLGKTGEVTMQTTETHTKGLVLHCKASTNKGEFSESHSFKSFAKVIITYTGCTIHEKTFGELSCTSKGAATGEIISNDLKATLIYTNKAAKEVGLVFKPEEAGGALAEYKCGGLVGSVKLTGAVITKLPNEQVGKSRLSFTWDYRQKGGIQEPTAYEEGTTKVSAFLTGLDSEQTGEETTETIEFSSGVTVVA
jgi:hypothetical protein